MISLYTSFCQTLIDTPIENFKISKIANNRLLYRNIYNGFLINYKRNFIFAGSVYSFNKEIDNKLLSGALGGLFGSIISQPLDYIKTQKQSKNISYNKIIYIKYFINNCMNGLIPRCSVSLLEKFIYFLI